MMKKFNLITKNRCGMKDKQASAHAASSAHAACRFNTRHYRWMLPPCFPDAVPRLLNAQAGSAMPSHAYRRSMHCAPDRHFVLDGALVTMRSTCHAVGREGMDEHGDLLISARNGLASGSAESVCLRCALKDSANWPSTWQNTPSETSGIGMGRACRGPGGGGDRIMRRRTFILHNAGSGLGPARTAMSWVGMQGTVAPQALALAGDSGHAKDAEARWPSRMRQDHGGSDGRSFCGALPWPPRRQVFGSVVRGAHCNAEPGARPAARQKGRG